MTQFLPKKDKKDPKDLSYFSHIKAFLGYTATSKQCLDYHEALYIDLDHTNYIEVSKYYIKK